MTRSASAIAAQVVQALVDAHGIAQPVAQVAARDVLHGEVLMLRQCAEVVDFRDGAVLNARDDLVLALESLAVVDLALRGAAAHDFEHDVAPQPLAAREVNRGEVAGGDFLDDAVTGHLDRGGILGGREQRLRGERRGALLGARLGHRLEKQGRA